MTEAEFAALKYGDTIKIKPTRSREDNVYLILVGQVPEHGAFAYKMKPEPLFTYLILPPEDWEHTEGDDD